MANFYDRRRMDSGMTTTTSRPSPAVRDAAISQAGDVDARRVRSRVRRLELTGPAGRLEAVLNEGSPDARFAAVVCHPHPQGGGTMHNKVVYHAMKALNAPE